MEERDIFKIKDDDDETFMGRIYIYIYRRAYTSLSEFVSWRQQEAGGRAINAPAWTVGQAWTKLIVQPEVGGQVINAPADHSSVVH